MAWLGYLVLLLVATRQRTNPFVFLLVVLGALGVLIFLAYLLKKAIDRYASRREFRRSFEIAKALSNHGMTIASSTPYAARLALLQPFELGRRSNSQMVKHFMESSPESEQIIWMMDYWYFGSGGRHRVWRSVTVALIECEVDLPHFHLSKEIPFQWLEKLAKAQDIDFEEHPTFNKLFRLMGEDEAAVRALFTTQVREKVERHPGLTIEGRGSQLLIYREHIVLAPDKWPEFLEEARDVAQLLAA